MKRTWTFAVCHHLGFHRMRPIVYKYIYSIAERSGRDSCWQFSIAFGWSKVEYVGVGCHVGAMFGSRGGPRRGAGIGDRTVDMTVIGNCLASRFGLVILICLVRQIFWGCEQPASSLAMYLPYIEMAFNSNKFIYGMPCGFVQKLFLGFNPTCAHHAACSAWKPHRQNWKPPLTVSHCLN